MTSCLPTSLRRTVVLFALLAGCAPPRPIDGRSAYFVDPTPIADAWLKAALAAPPRSFSPIDAVSKLPPAVRGDTSYWSERFLQPRARPLEHDDAEVAVHLSGRSGPDLLRWRYRAENLSLTVVESVNFMLVSVAGVTLGAEPDAEIARVAGLVLDVSGNGHDWRFSPARREGAELRFSTNASLDAWSMPSWADRVDGGTAQGSLYFLLFKKSPSRVGYRNADAWFEEEFRKHFSVF